MQVTVVFFDIFTYTRKYTIMHLILATLFMYIDSHAHLLSKELTADILHVLDRAKEAQISTIINISCSPQEWQKAISFCARHTSDSLSLHPTIGIHPDYYGVPKVEGFEEQVRDLQIQMERCLHENTSIKAIGECGLDYFREFDREAQTALFEMQIKLGLEHDLPLVVHVREAFEDFFPLMDVYPEAKVILHCFTGTPEQAEKILTYPNTTISFSGIVTFDKTGNMDASVQVVPIDRMLIETDSPYLAPVPKRGKINEPSFVVHTAKKIAEIKGIPPQEVAQITSRNALSIFRV